MAGHSKWANIRFRKAAQDNKRGKLFTKLIREITVSAKTGGGEPDSNPRLRAAIDKGLSNNMKRDTIEQAIKRGTGELEGVEYEEIRYEGYGQGGVAILVETTTDNRNRTVSEVRHAFNKYGGNMGTEGSVAYLFNRVGSLYYGDDVDEDTLMNAAIEAGAEDVIVNDDGSMEVITNADDFTVVKEALDASNLVAEQAEIIQKPATEIELDAETAEKVMKLIDVIEELDDVQDVFTNANFPDDMNMEDA